MLQNNISHRILRCLNKSNNSQYNYGKNWYKNANRTCLEIAKEVEQPLDIVVKTLAFLSPSNKWERNIIDTKNILNAHKNKIPLNDIKVCTFNSNKTKVIKLLEGKNTTITGRKVSSFYHNIYYPKTSNKVTIDRWIMRLIINKDKSPSSKEYDQIESEFQRVAEGLDLLPSELQAVCWGVIRNSII